MASLIRSKLITNARVVPNHLQTNPILTDISRKHMRSLINQIFLKALFNNRRINQKKSRMIRRFNHHRIRLGLELSLSLKRVRSLILERGLLKDSRLMIMSRLGCLSIGLITSSNLPLKDC
jgi:hypothetical protein